MQKKRLMMVHIGMTNRCNLRCTMCSSRLYPNESEELSLEQWKVIIANITRFKVGIITFGGGEPLIREKELAELVKVIVSRGVTVNIVTNATLLTKALLEDIIQYRDRIIFLVSLDGLKEDNDRIRGNGVFDKVIESMNLLQKHNWTFYISSVLMPGNFSNYIKFLKFLHANFPQVRIDIQPVVLDNVAYSQGNKFDLNEGQLAALKNILLFLHANGGNIFLCRQLKIIDSYWDYFTNTLHTENQCKTGTENFNINHKGNLWICGKELEYPLHMYKLEQVFATEEYQNEMKRVENCKAPCLMGCVVL